MSRVRAIDSFLGAAGWGGARREQLPNDASFRRYTRLRRGAATAMLMDAPPPEEDVRPFVAVARHLRNLGLSAPEVLAADTERGLLLLEDFGDATFTRLLARGADEGELYTLATDLLVSLHRHPGSAAAALPAFDLDRLSDEAELLLDWYCPAVGIPAPDADGFRIAVRQVLPQALERPPTLVLRDYHVDNLMRLEGRTGIAACGLLDFQDAVIGPPAYDLASAVEDARRDLPEDIREAAIARYAAAFPDYAALRRDMAVLGAQRHIRVLGVFTRLARRDGKPGYLAHMPRLWRMLERNLAHPALGPLDAWFGRNLPPSARTTPAA